MRAKSKIFHMKCFRCAACEKQLVPGDEFALRQDELFDENMFFPPGRASTRKAAPISTSGDKTICGS